MRHKCIIEDKSQTLNKKELLNVNGAHAGFTVKADYWFIDVPRLS